jgi:electron transfer flavoprotein alpha subunit
MILLVAEHHDGRLAPAMAELTSFGAALADCTGDMLLGVVLGCSPQGPAEELARLGIDVIAADHEALALYNPETYIAALTALAAEIKPASILIAHTATGWDYAPRLAVALEGSCITAVSGIAPGPVPAFTRRVLGGKMVLESEPVPGKCAVVTMQPGSMRPRTTVTGYKPAARAEIDLGTALNQRFGSHTLGYREAVRGELDLGRAEVIVAAGRGVDPERMDLIRELAACFHHCAVGASRPVVDAGRLPLEHQVGQTGQTVAPRLYLACGVSGAVQHVAGMIGSELIVAVNLDRQAAIFDVAHLGIVADLHEFIPLLIARLRAGMETT